MTLGRDCTETCMQIILHAALSNSHHAMRCCHHSITLVATSADSVPSSYLVRITIAPIELLSEIFNEGGIKIILLSNIRPIIIYFHSSQCRLIPYLHQRSMFFKTNSSNIVAILELIRGAQCLIEVIRSSGEEM